LIVRDDTLSHCLHPLWLVLICCGLLSWPHLIPAVVDNDVVGSNNVVVGHVLLLCQRPLSTLELWLLYNYLISDQPVFDRCPLATILVDCSRHSGTCFSWLLALLVRLGPCLSVTGIVASFHVIICRYDLFLADLLA
jgi:hypothetical protein